MHITSPTDRQGQVKAIKRQKPAKEKGAKVLFILEKGKAQEKGKSAFILEKRESTETPVRYLAHTYTHAPINFEDTQISDRKSCFEPGSGWYDDEGVEVGGLSEKGDWIGRWRPGRKERKEIRVNRGNS